MPGFWRKCRIGFRWFRITVWFIVLVAVCLLAWFNQIGVPEFLKAHLVAALRDRGVELQFTRLRLRIVRGLVAENVQVSQARMSNGPQLTAREVQVRINLQDLFHRHKRIQVDGLVLTDGTFIWPLTTNFVATATNLQLDLHFHTDDTWVLDHCFATVAGTRIAIAAQIGHAPELRNWEWFRNRPKGTSPVFLAQLEQMADTLKKIELPGTPVLKLVVNGDARDASTFDLRLTASVPTAITPWGYFHKTELMADARMVRADSWPKVNLRLTAGEDATRWGTLQDGLLTLHTEAAPAPQIPPATLHLETARVITKFGHTKNFQFDAQLNTNAVAVLNPDPQAGWWTNLAPFTLTWQTRLDELFASDSSANEITCDGGWQFPDLTLNHLTARLGGGDLTASAALNVVARELVFTNDSRFDIHVIRDLLTAKASAWLDQIAWTEPPWLQGNGRLQLPPWGRAPADWRTDIEPSVQLNAELGFTNAQASGVALDVVSSHLAYSNLVWRLPNLQILCARSRLNLNVTEDEATKQFACDVQGQFDPGFLRPFFHQTNASKAFQICQFTEVPVLAAHLSGRLYDWPSLTATGHVALTNFAVRGQWMDTVTSAFDYTNLTLDFRSPRLWRAGGTQTMTADVVELDFGNRMIRFTNGFSTAEPMAITRTIGPKTAALVEPYQFLAPPTAHVNGHLGLHDMNGGHDLDDVDMTFDIVKPTPFRWSKIESPQVTGTIHWLGQSLILSNVVGKFYEGDAQGSATFDFRAAHSGADYRFDFVVTNSNLHLLANDLISPTNHLEGRLSGELDILQASTESVQSWNGVGHAHLRDGLIWDIPVFGILSPVLNGISPGLGDSRATEAKARFIITNGVFATDSLMIRSTMSSLEYKGTIDMDERVDARVTLELLRNAPLVGPFISTLLTPVSKALQYRVTGNLSNPHTAPVYVPELFLAPLHPFRTLEDLFTPSTTTNKPAH